MRALVTGGAGFIGSHIVDQLIHEGYGVIVIDNESTGFRQNVNSAAQYIRGDTRNVDHLDLAFCEKPNVIFHLAGQASAMRSSEAPEEALDVNVKGTINVVKKCLEYRVPRLLYASSMTVYGHPSSLPVAEHEPCRPASYYGITKFAAERYVHATPGISDLNFDFSVTSFRMFNVYGDIQQQFERYSKSPVHWPG